jgi:hypothetical protein
MITLAKRIGTALLYDESMAQRVLAAALFGLGTILEGGGVIPGTDTVLPGVAGWYHLGGPLKLMGIYLGAGGKLTLPETAPPKLEIPKA